MAKRIHRPRQQTPEKAAAEKVIHERFSNERPSREKLLAAGEIETTGLRQSEYWALQRVCTQLKPLREAAGLSLANLSARTGIDRAAISKLENGIYTNPTISTINRYLAALGKRAVVQIVDGLSP